MGTHHRGFIPLVAIVLLGLVAMVGGVAATVYVRGEAEPVEDTAQETSASVPISAQVASSTETEAQIVPEEPAALVRATISSESRAICEEVLSKPEAPKSLLGDAQAICRQFEKLELDTLEQRERWLELEEKLKQRAGTLRKVDEIYRD